MAVFLSLITSVLYGSGDFLGGLSSRRNTQTQVLITVSLAGTLPLLCVAPLFTSSFTIKDLLLGALAGIFGAGGLGIFYRGLARGPMSLVAPLTATTSAGVPVIWDLSKGQQPGFICGVGILLAFVAIFVASRGQPNEGSPISTSAILEALLAGIGFGLFFCVLSETSTGSAPWPIVAGRTSAAVVLLASAAVRKVSIKPTGSWLTLLGCSICDTGANVAFLFALRYGQLGPVAVLASLYPAVTVLLARFALGENLDRRRVAGLLITLVAITLIAWG
ncbi:MAG: DMT family transporter [Acidimicrobiales bacterium]|nr:DMT family transporter [Acidimicrobiales bacterium]